MLGDRLVRRKRRRKSADAFLAELAALTPGDLVVHADHGIARYEGLTSVMVGKAPHDCVALSYACGDKLYVPVENIDVLSRYGSDSEKATLDRLGGEAWQRRKSRMKERYARSPVSDHDRRTAPLGPTKSPKPTPLPEFIDRFLMKRLTIRPGIAGLEWSGSRWTDLAANVGLQTEVALRAAFVAAMAGYQVALICLTTLLARQHYSNFARFQGFPIEIDDCRGLPAAEAKATRDLNWARLTRDRHARAALKIDKFKSWIGFVDEEQHEVVQGKAQGFEGGRSRPHVTATPIPRTLRWRCRACANSASSRPRRSIGLRCGPMSRPGTRWLSARRC
jgi:transcription-repair coupling factor (superfamily II helicase)